MHDLLIDPLIRIRTGAGEVAASLPELLARLSKGDVLAYTGTRPHQADPWHVFLVQLAASVLARRPEITPEKPPCEAAFWRDGLLELADRKGSAWHLLGQNLTEPAFMQHPLPGGKEELDRAFKPKAVAPDELDVLITAKDHDLKSARVRPDDVESWVLSLVSCQTMSGFLGAGNYGTLRMNGGFGSRSVVSMVSSVSPGRRFQEELPIVYRMRAATLAQHVYAERGVVLTWLRPWARDDHLHFLPELEPWFVEASRPIRLVASADGPIAMGATSKARLIGPKAHDNGVVGDPWTPLNMADRKKGESAMTLAAAGWSPARLTDLLFEDGFKLTQLQKSRPGEGDLWFIGSTLVRGQGTTEGFHQFKVLVPAKVRQLLLRPDAARPLGEFARELLKQAADASRALRAALTSLAEGGPEQIDFERKGITAWSNAASAAATQLWTERYFPTLWQAADPERRPAVQAQWKAALVADMRKALSDAEARLPIPCGRRWRSSVRARWVLGAALRKATLLPLAQEATEEERTSEDMS